MEATPTSSLPFHLPGSPKGFSCSSPSPPPPPPSYLISEVHPADLPPPPPYALWHNMTSRSYMCCYDPPSPEVKSEYDPQLPPGFFSTPDIFPSSPPPPVPLPPSPPTPSIQQPARDWPQHNADTISAVMNHPEMESESYNEDSIETSSMISLASSTTLMATCCPTPDSSTSFLPSQTLRASPLPTEAVTISSRVGSDSLMSFGDTSLIPSLFSVRQEYNVETNISNVSQGSFITEATSDVPVSPGLAVSSLTTGLKIDQSGSLTQTAERDTQKESFSSEIGSSVPSVVSYTTNDTAGPAVMSSPLSTDVPSLPSLPTDPDSGSSGLGSLTGDTWSLSTEMDSQAGYESNARIKSSGCSPSDGAYVTGESGTASPTFTGSCTITPMPTDYLTSHSRSPTLTPLASPIPSSPLPHFDAVHLSNKPQSPSGSEYRLNEETVSTQPLQLDSLSVMSSSAEPLQPGNGELISALPEPLQAGKEEMVSASLEPSQLDNRSDQGVSSLSPKVLEATNKEITSTPARQCQTAPPLKILEKQLDPFDHSSNHSTDEFAQRYNYSTLSTGISHSSSSQGYEQCTSHTSGFVSPSRYTESNEENSSINEFLLDRMPLFPHNVYVTGRDNDGIKIENHGVSSIPVSVSNGRLSEQITKVQSNVLKREEKENKGKITDDSGKRDSVYENYDNDFIGEDDHEERTKCVDECTENFCSQMVKDVNGNISYSGLRNDSEAQLENREEIIESNSEVLTETTQAMKSVSVDTIHLAEGTLERQVENYDNIPPENLLRSQLSPVSSLTCSHITGCNFSSLHDISLKGTSHKLVSLHPQPSVSSFNVDNQCLHSGTSPTGEHSSVVSPEPKPEVTAQVSSSSKDAIELLDAVVVTLENLSNDLPISPTLRAPTVLSSESDPVTELQMTDQSVTPELEGSGILLIGGKQSKDVNTETQTIKVCTHTLPMFPSVPDPLPHPPPMSPILLSHPTISTASLQHVGDSASYCEPSQCVTSPCPSLTTNACSASPLFWNMSHTDPQCHHVSCSPDEHNTSVLVRDAMKFSSEERMHFRSCPTSYQESLPMVCEMPSPSLHSSPQTGSLLDGQPSSSPAPRSRTPPTPPPRSCHNTPRTSLAPPLPPQRQYMLVPINQPLEVLRRLSPPPAPPRSTSVQRASPPPPPRPSAPCLPLPVKGYTEGPPLPPFPVMSCHTTPPQPALTPVPEESSAPQSPVHSRSSQPSSPISDGAPSTMIPLSDPLSSQKLQPNPYFSPSGNSGSPPALPPPPEDEQDEEELPPLPPPPPPIEPEDEIAHPLPLPPPPPDVLLSPPPPLSPLQGKVEPSSPFTFLQMPALPDLCMANLHNDLSSAPSSDPDLAPPAVNDIAIPPPVKPLSVTASQKSAMPNSQAVDASAAPPLPPLPGTTHAPASPLPEPPCAPPPGPSCGEVTKPSLITTSPYGKMVVVRSDLPLPSPEEEVRIAFTAAKDWGFLAEGEETLSVYTQLRPVIQQGPQCGLVALGMASQVFPQTVEVEELLAAARAEGFTRHGEMFSAVKLARLAEKVVPGLQAEVRRDVLSSPATLLQLLLQGDLVLVPYDAERNHQPGLKGGHKAHWGVVCGCLVQSHALTFPTTSAKLDSHVDQLWHLRPRSRAGRSRSVTPCTPTVPASSKIGQRSLRTPDGASGGELTQHSVSCSRVNTPMLADLRNDVELKLVPFWRQGKSRKVVTAPLDQLCESNDQLISYPPPSTPHEAEYVVESLQDALAGQVVVLHKTKVALSDLVGLLQEK